MGACAGGNPTILFYRQQPILTGGTAPLPKCRTPFAGYGEAATLLQDNVMVQRPENIAGTHRGKVEAGVTGQSLRAPTGTLPVTGPAGFVFVRLPQARTLYHQFFVYSGCRRLVSRKGVRPFSAWALCRYGTTILLYQQQPILAGAQRPYDNAGCLLPAMGRRQPLLQDNVMVQRPENTAGAHHRQTPWNALQVYCACPCPCRQGL
jgi:hypothetical protein